jgi:hypothetical protein
MIAQKSKQRQSSTGRRPVSLSSALEKSLLAYASAAVAAGVSLLAMTNSVEAKVVYTPAHTNIPVNTGSVLLDLNHDGIADFSLWNSKGAYGHQAFGTLNVGCAAVPVSNHNSTCRYQNNEIWGEGMVSGRFASALHPGFMVKANKSYFQQGRKLVGSQNQALGPVADMANIIFTVSSTGQTSSASRGQWFFTKRRYLGLQFMIGKEVHYGWARLAVTLPTGGFEGIQATLTGYAYETIPNKPIITGKTKGSDVVILDPASLGHLAQGASGIPVWRKSGGNWKSAAH